MLLTHQWMERRQLVSVEGLEGNARLQVMVKVRMARFLLLKDTTVIGQYDEQWLPVAGYIHAMRP